MTDKSVSKLVYEIVKSIPKGKVTTYGVIAKKVGIHPRQVGRILHNNPDSSNVPCHRVVNFAGKLSESFAFGGHWEQSKRLQAEGVKTQGNKLNLLDYKVVV